MPYRTPSMADRYSAPYGGRRGFSCQKIGAYILPVRTAFPILEWYFFGTSLYPIVLDFLGFSRSNLRLINELHGIKWGNFFLALFPSHREAPGRELAVEAMRKRRIVHGPSLP